MADWEKVRVTFNDADGNEVSVVMWQDKNSPQSVCTSPDVSTCWIGWNLVHGVTVSPIRELPTGVGAAIRRLGTFRMGYPSDDVYVRTAYGRWTNGISTWKPSQIAADDWEYEVLSEGIQIGDVK